jgi:hypothetical protein
MFYIFATGMVSTSLMKLAMIIHSSVSCMDEIEATPTIINKIFNSYQDPKLCDILKMFSRQISLRSRIIKSAFFVVDWTLMYSVRYSNTPPLMTITISIFEFWRCWAESRLFWSSLTNSAKLRKIWRQTVRVGFEQDFQWNYMFLNVVLCGLLGDFFGSSIFISLRPVVTPLMSCSFLAHFNILAAQFCVTAHSLRITGVQVGFLVFVWF